MKRCWPRLLGLPLGRQAAWLRRRDVARWSEVRGELREDARPLVRFFFSMAITGVGAPCAPCLVVLPSSFFFRANKDFCCRAITMRTLGQFSVFCACISKSGIPCLDLEPWNCFGVRGKPTRSNLQSPASQQEPEDEGLVSKRDSIDMFFFWGGAEIQCRSAKEYQLLAALVRCPNCEQLLQPFQTCVALPTRGNGSTG